MGKTIRQIIKIDEELCNGCGVCVPACAEGALQIVDGKARMISEKYCDGLGACLGECPQGAISYESREAEDFDEEAAMAHVGATRPQAGEHAHQAQPHQHSHGAGFVCPSARTIDRTQDAPCGCETSAAQGAAKSELRQWPIKLYLVNPSAPYFQNADLLLSADCVPFAYGSLHADFLKGKTLVTGCPKFDDTDLYLEKLTAILQANDVRSITVLMMEVPCCSGLQRLADAAVAASGKNVRTESVIIGLDGELRA